MAQNDIYDINGRIKNIIAKEDIALSPTGNVLVNYYTLVLKRIYEFSETLPESYKAELNKILRHTEDMPMLVIKVSQNGDKWMSLYDEILLMKPKFKTNEEALEYFLKEYEDLGGDSFWMEAENSNDLTDNHRKVMKLSRSIQLCKALIKKEKNA